MSVNRAVTSRAIHRTVIWSSTECDTQTNAKPPLTASQYMVQDVARADTTRDKCVERRETLEERHDGYNLD